MRVQASLTIETVAAASDDVPALPLQINTTKINQNESFPSFFFFYLGLTNELVRKQYHTVFLPVRARRDSLKAPDQREQE